MNELAKLRAKTGLTQAAFAAMFGYNHSTVSLWESGDRKPKQFMLEAIRKKVAEYMKARK